MAYKTLRVEKSDAITTIYLNRPSQRNALNSEMIGELRALTDELRDDVSTRAVIVTGAGKAFSVGADVDMLRRIGEGFAPEQTRAEIVKWRDTFDAVERLPQITIAAINGLAYGGGVVLALACDFGSRRRTRSSACPKSNWAWCSRSAARSGSRVSSASARRRK